MRLGQLARKLALRPVEIVNYLALHSIQIDSGGNTRLEDEHVNLVLQKFAPESLVEEIMVPTEGDIKADPVATPELVIEKPEESPEISSPEIKGEEKIEVIKAPKIELSGLKVLGKIELPGTKKKEPEISQEPSSEENASASASPADKPVEQPRREKRVPYVQRKERSNTSQRPAKNPIALQRERETREQEEKRTAAIEIEKEKRTLHYLKKVNVAQPTKSARVIEERIVEKPIVQAPAPNTVWGKFKRWINS